MSKKPDRTVKCAYCGREFIEPIPHKCNKNYRKRNLKWINLMEDKRKPFNAEEFISNEETPVETRTREKVIIYNTNRISNDNFQVCGDILSEGQSLLALWLKDGHFYKTCRVNDRDLFFSPKKTTRRMTNRELSFWLMEHPEEHREYTYDPMNQGDGLVRHEHVYNSLQAHKEVDGFIKIRSNGGEWREPLIERED